jgi:hypothetical protein
MIRAGKSGSTPDELDGDPKAMSTKRRRPNLYLSAALRGKFFHNGKTEPTAS